MEAKVNSKIENWYEQKELVPVSNNAFIIFEWELQDNLLFLKSIPCDTVVYVGEEILDIYFHTGR